MNDLLTGRVILVVEDEIFIALDLNHIFRSVGAQVVQVRSLRDAMRAAENADLSAAVIDHGLGEEYSTDLCRILKERNIPFLIYSGYSTIEGACAGAVLLQKPAAVDVLISTVSALLDRTAGTSTAMNGHCASAI